MRLFEDFFHRKKDWKLNRQKFGRCTFISFHHVDTSLNLLYNKLASFLNFNFAQFDYFGPYGLTRDMLIQGFDVESHILEINKSHPTFSISFENSNEMDEIASGTICRFNLPNQKTSFLAIQFFRDSKQYEFSNLINPETFYFGSYAEDDFINWQSQSGSIENYKYRGGLNYTNNELGEKVVDISDRPGREVYTKYFNYCGAAEMWFGPLVYQYINQELLLSFEDALEIKVLPNNTTYVHLYEHIYDGDEPKNQEIQRRFREHIRIDEIQMV